MPVRQVPLMTGEYYHVYNRGVNRASIFLRPENWLFFLKRLRDFFYPDKADVIAYCLMPNHYHLLVCLKSDGFGPRVMQPFLVSYTKAVNKQNRRVGPLFQGPFHASHLLYLSRYIHLNPVRARYVDKPQDWVYSSYQNYLGLRRRSMLRPEIVLDQFPGVQAYAEFVEHVECEEEMIGYLMFEE